MVRRQPDEPPDLLTNIRARWGLGTARVCILKMIERHRPAPSIEPTSPPAPTPSKRSAVPLRLNRNFANYPLARDARVDLHWWKSAETGEWISELPFEDRILLILPSDTPANKRRGLTGFDINVLFQLLAEAQHVQSTRLTFKYAPLLRRLQLTEQTQNRESLRSSLELLSLMVLQFDWCWYDDKKQQAKTQRAFPPPIKKVDLEGQSIVVTIHDAWFRLVTAKSYYVEIPLPLPNVATDQNAALLILTSGINAPVPDSRLATYRWKQSAFARKAGLSSNRRKERLAACLARVALWFEQMGGELTVVYGRRDGEGVVAPGKVGFIVAKLRVPRRQRGLERNLEGVSDVTFRPPKKVSDVTFPRPKKVSDVSTMMSKQTRRKKTIRSSRNEAAGAAELRFAGMEGKWDRSWIEADEDSNSIPDPHADRR